MTNELTLTCATGTTITLTEPDTDGYRRILMDHPDAAADLRNTEVGRVIITDNDERAYQPAMFCPWGLTPDTLRDLATIIEDANQED